MSKYRLEGIGKNKKIRAERMKPIPLMGIDYAEIAGTRINRRRSNKNKIDSENIHMPEYDS